jgi:hypothetical protein
MFLDAMHTPLVDEKGKVTLAGLLLLNKKLEWVQAPAAANSPGTQNQVAYDATHFYVCIARSTWVRTVLATW